MDEATTREIDKTVWKILREAGLTEPPIRAEDLLRFLDLNREYFDLQNPTFLEKAKHKLKVNGKKIIDVIRKVKPAGCSSS